MEVGFHLFLISYIAWSFYFPHNLTLLCSSIVNICDDHQTYTGGGNGLSIEFWAENKMMSKAFWAIVMKWDEPFPRYLRLITTTAAFEHC